MRFGIVIMGTMSLVLLAASSVSAESGEKSDNGRDLANYLNLTEEQREEVKEINKKSIEKLQPIYEQIKQLRKEADVIRRENMEQFISMLTPEQKKTFEGLYEKPKKSVKFFGSFGKGESD